MSRQASVAHPGDAPRPAEAVLHYHGLNTNSVDLLQDGDVCDVVVPFDVEDGAELSLVELLKLHQVLLVQRPGLAAVEQSRDDNRLVDHKFGGSTKVFVLEDSFIKLAKCRMCSSDSVVNVFLGSAVRRQDATEVWEVVDLLEVGFTDGDVKNWKRCFWSGLGEHLSLFDVYGEAKATVSAAKVVDRLLQGISRMARSSIVICILELCDGSGAGVST